MAVLNHILGIDPGLSGALALYGDAGLILVDVPTHEIKVARTKKRTPDLYALARWFDLYGKDIRLAIVENVGAMPDQGVSSSFNFGFVAGVLQAMVASALIPMRLVRPNVWKRQMGVVADKDSSRRMASQIFPAYSHMWARVKDDGRAEAALLAYYGAKFSTH